MSDRVASGRMPVSVGVDGYNLALARGTGIATYARTLAIALGGMGCEVDLVFGLSVPPKTPPQAREAEFFSRLSEDEGFDGRAGRKPTLRGAIKRALQLPRARTLVEVPLSGRVEMADFEERIPPFRSIWTHGNLFDVAHRHFRRYGRFLEVRMESPPEVMHWTYPLPLKLAGAKNIYTIHDLVPMILPHTTLDDKNFMHALVSRCLVEADLICTVSESSRKDILSLFGPAEEKVINTYQSSDLTLHELGGKAESEQKIRRLFDLEPDGYFLFYGAIEPKKNVGRLIESYLTANLDRPLVIVGGRGWRSERELRLLSGGHGRSLKAARNVIHIDYLPRAMLRILISGARAVFYPSLYEGFGLPALEAMALGAPLVYGAAGSLPEIAGDAALPVDPYDVAAMTNAFERLEVDEDLRRRLAESGPRQAEQFSMARYRERLEGLYAALRL